MAPAICDNMRILTAFFLLTSCMIFSSTQLHADQPAWSGFLPYGFYQPYGAGYSSSIRTPPYFATNPPVYYGQRFSRPYGLSPFAAPPQLRSSSPYRGQRANAGVEVQKPRSASAGASLGAPGGEIRRESLIVSDHRVKQVGAVRLNPFVTDKNLVKH